LKFSGINLAICSPPTNNAVAQESDSIAVGACTKTVE